MTPPPEERAALAGHDWTTEVRQQLHDEGRRASDGWPGTLTEARARVTQLFAGAEPLAPDQIEHLSRVLYAAARERWLEQREPTVADE